MKMIVLNLFVLFSLNSHCQSKIDETKTASGKIEDANDAYQKTQEVPIDIRNSYKVYEVAYIDVKPEYPGAGTESMYGFIRKNFVIPQEIIDGKETKTIFVSFIVEKDGSLSNIKVLRDVGYGTGKEAIRVLKLMPKWIPGLKNGYPVRSMYSIPIRLYANQ